MTPLALKNQCLSSDGECKSMIRHKSAPKIDWFWGHIYLGRASTLRCPEHKLRVIRVSQYKIILILLGNIAQSCRVRIHKEGEIFLLFFFVFIFSFIWYIRNNKAWLYCHVHSIFVSFKEDYYPESSGFQENHKNM